MTPSQSFGVAWPNRRADIANALSALVTLRPGDVQPWPDLTNAVHWLIDDTWWDQHPPTEDIGLLLRDQAEADAISAVTGPLISLLDELGPSRPDAAYLRHVTWGLVRERAQVALALLESKQ